MSRSFDQSRHLHQQALSLLPKGVSSNARYWGEAETLYATRAKGAYLWDVDGNRTIDYRLAFGPVILGHAYDEVDYRVWQAIQNGVTLGLTTPAEISAAQKVVDMCPAVEKVRFVNSGSEAAMHAIRLARAYTGREKIVKFEGGYHGTPDYLLFSTYAPPEAYGSRLSPIPVPASSGIPACLRDLILTVPFNDRQVLARTLRDHGHEIAAVISEPMLGNFGSVTPQPGFLDFISAQCREFGCLFILDEVKTGFRIALGGAQELYGIRPDLTIYAKALGNGYPVAAYGGRREIMDLVGDGVSQGGTFSGNSLSAAAVDVTLEILQSQPVLEHIAQNGQRLQDGMRTIFERAGIPVLISGYPAIFGVAFGIQEAADARLWARCDRGAYQRFTRGLLERGVLVDHDPREPWCLCYSHTAADIDETLQAVEDAIREIQFT
jgi:glutamate-1-semialdehyde 2,1-aminomutase